MLRLACLALRHRRRRCGIGSRQNPIVFGFGAQVPLRLDGPVFRCLQNKRPLRLGRQRSLPALRTSLSEGFKFCAPPPAPRGTMLRRRAPAAPNRNVRLFCKNKTTPSPSALYPGGVRGGGAKLPLPEPQFLLAERGSVCPGDAMSVYFASTGIPTLNEDPPSSAVGKTSQTI